MIVYGQEPVATTPLSSVTSTLKVTDTLSLHDALPISFSVRPAGSVPTIENVYGVVPPVTVGAGLLNATRTSPVVTAEPGSAGTPMIVYGQDPVATTPLASVTCRLKAPEAVGVPVIDPS